MILLVFSGANNVLEGTSGRSELMMSCVKYRPLDVGGFGKLEFYRSQVRFSYPDIQLHRILNT